MVVFLKVVYLMILDVSCFEIKKKGRRKWGAKNGGIVVMVLSIVCWKILKIKVVVVVVVVVVEVELIFGLKVKLLLVLWHERVRCMYFCVAKGWLVWRLNELMRFLKGVVWRAEHKHFLVCLRFGGIYEKRVEAR